MIDGIFSFASTVINKLFPDKSEQEKQRLVNELALATQEFQLAQGQQEINKVEAASDNLFVAGWRPFIGWICGFALSFNYILGPYIINPIIKHLGETPLAPMSMTELMPILLGLLGLGAYRSYEKVKGIK